MGRFLIDTDVLIDFLRGKEKAIALLESFPEDSMSCCSVITIAELFAGMLESEKEKTVKLIDSLEVIPVDRNISELAGKIKKDTKSHQIELDDCFIAATAMINDAELVTRNYRHYPVKGIRLRILS